MSEPASVRLKRKAGEHAPKVLVLERRKKSAKLHYIRESDTSNAKPSPSFQEKYNDALVKRVFHLDRKRKGEQDEVATVTEKRTRSEQFVKDDADEVPRFEPAPTESFKKPGKNAAVKVATTTAPLAEMEDDRKRMEDLADYLQQAVLEEIDRERQTREPLPRPSKPVSQQQRLTPPRLSGRKSREIHERRMAGKQLSPARKHLDDDGDEYIYDTYILASTSVMSTAEAELPGDLVNVGYLVIEEEDEALWETYLEDEVSEKDWNSEEEDENAEDYYGADYPEDELDSDDGFDRRAYDYRGRGASDNEEWDEDTGAFSDDEDDEFEQVLNPLGHGTMRTELAKYLKDSVARH